MSHPPPDPPSTDRQGDADASPRRILHCDMDSFFAAVHQRDDPSLVGKPVIIGGSPQGRGVVAAASYEVRRYGVHSAMPAATAVKLCPHAIFIKPDGKRYKAESEKIFEIFSDFTPLVQPASLDEAYLDVSEHLGELGSATAVAKEIRRRVREERGLTVSVGVAPNRLVAKIASDYRKPDGLTVVKPHQVEEFLAPMPVRALHGVGPATEKAIHALGARTIAELRAIPLEVLQKRFGRHGQGLYNASRGIDERPVRVDRVRKSLGHERTYARDVRSVAEMDEHLAFLAGKVSADLKKREILGRTITVKVRYPDFTTLTRARTLPAPTASAQRILQAAQDLMRQTDASTRGVRLLGVTSSSLVHADKGQLWLFDPDDLD